MRKGHKTINVLCPHRRFILKFFAAAAFITAASTALMPYTVNYNRYDNQNSNSYNYIIYHNNIIQRTLKICK